MKSVHPFTHTGGSGEAGVVLWGTVVVSSLPPVGVDGVLFGVLVGGSVLGLVVETVKDKNTEQSSIILQVMKIV